MNATNVHATRTVFLAPIAMFFLSLNANAAEVRGKILAIAPDGSWVTVRETGEEAGKPTTLDVAAGTSLDSIRVGASVVIDFNLETKTVTSVRSNTASTSGTSEHDRLIRIRYSFASDGTTETTVGVVPGNEEFRPSSTKQVHPGLWRANHLFDSPEALEDLHGPLLMIDGVSFSPQQQALSIDPGSGERKDATALQYPTRFKLPLVVEADVFLSADSARLQLSTNCSSAQNLHPFVDITTANDFQTVTIAEKWVVQRDPKSGKPTIRETGTKGGATDDEKTVALVVKPPIRIGREEVYLFRLGCFSQGNNSEPVFLKRLSVEGRFVPTLGLALASQDGRIVVDRALPNSFAFEAGLKAGDEIIAIEGKRPTTLPRAIQLLGMTQFGETWVLKAKRGKSIKTYEIKAE